MNAVPAKIDFGSAAGIERLLIRIKALGLFGEVNGERISEVLIP